MKLRIFLLFFLVLFYSWGFAETKTSNLKAPVPVTCISSSFSKTGDIHWFNVSLRLVNNCGRDVDFQNSSITFKNGSNLSTNFWGDFAPLSFPDNPLFISSQSDPTGGFLSSLFLHIPEEPWATSILHDKQGITIKYGTSVADYVPNSVKVYLNGSPIQTGTLVLNNRTTKPSTITQGFASIDLIFNGQRINTVEVPWLGSLNVPDLAPGAYQIQPQTLRDSQGNSYQGTAAPSSVTVTANQTVSSDITYKQIINVGQIRVAVPALPSALTGFTGTPSIILTRDDIGASVTQSVPWNAISTIGNLENNITYRFSTAPILFNNVQCNGTFNPVSLASRSVSPLTTQLSYTCSQVAQNIITINASGLPTSTSSITVVFQPTDGTSPISKAVPISNGSGSTTVSLKDGMVFSVTSTDVASHVVSITPQPFMSRPNGILTVAYAQQAAGRMIGYVPGWKTPPSASQLANAGYTHAMIAFGVFSTSQPGVIVPSFDTITPAYIQSLHQAGIKAILSLGGALTSIPNTSVDFHQVLTLASSPTAFQQTFISSIENLVNTYGFDGIDIDIEHGLIGQGNFSAPTGDIAVLANILNSLHQLHPNYLITLTPQVANIAATSGFDQTWGNYASLIMQTHNALSWVGIQVYNTGCAFGIDLVCYADEPTSPNLSVAMATDLLENWPSQTPSGQATGFRPYISNLRPDQVVLGYPAPNAQGASDGGPVKPTSVIKRALNCLRTGVTGPTGCDTYTPPRRYSNMGGVFNWEVTFDQSNNFRFATDLAACVKQGICS